MSYGTRQKRGEAGSYYGELCYNDKHGHNNPASAWGPGLLELFRRVRQEMRKLDSDAILWTEGMNDAFVLGIRGIFPGPDRAIDMPEKEGEEGQLRRAVVERIEKLWIKGGEYLFYGRFMDDVGLKVSDPDVLAKVYKHTTGIAIPVWNTKSVPSTFNLIVDPDALGIKEINRIKATSLDTGNPLLQQISGNTLEVILTLPVHEVDVVILKIED